MLHVFCVNVITVNHCFAGQPMAVKVYVPPSQSPKKLTPQNIIGNVKDVEGPLRSV